MVSSLEADAARLSDELETTARRPKSRTRLRGGGRRPKPSWPRDMAAFDAATGDLSSLRAAEEAFAVARGEKRACCGRALERDAR